MKSFLQVLNLTTKVSQNFRQTTRGFLINGFLVKNTCTDFVFCYLQKRNPDGDDGFTE